jgi:hypothetical protein
MAENKNENFFKIEGKVHVIFPTNQVSDKFKKREFVLLTERDYNEKTYTEKITFQVLQEKVDRLDTLQIGDEVEVGFSVSGREWAPPAEPEKVKYFNSLNAIVINHVKKVNTEPEATSNTIVDQAEQDGFDDLPF